ncbi:GNAT family N-acetyltransferase [Microbacterium galbum]|uniref:GNAT family N-acetyltransferase n=1 Tax=Microbacterium galbum TaxID=3075994 RepID=UPI003461427A
MFEVGGLGRPVGDEQPNELLLQARIGLTPVGAIYICSPVLVAVTLVQDGTDIDRAGWVAGRIRAIEAATVLPGVRGRGIGGALVQEAVRRLRQDSTADFLLARIAGLDLHLRRWWEHQGFTVGRNGQELRVNGSPIRYDPSHVDSWMQLAEGQPETSVSF